MVRFEPMVFPNRIAKIREAAEQTRMLAAGAATGTLAESYLAMASSLERLADLEANEQGVSSSPEGISRSRRP